MLDSVETVALSAGLEEVCTIMTSKHAQSTSLGENKSGVTVMYTDGVYIVVTLP